MGGPDRRLVRLGLTVLAPAALAALLAACGPSAAPKTLPPQTAAQKPEPQDTPAAEPPVPAKPKDDTTVMVDDGGARAKPPETLVEASRAERERRQSMDKPAVRIDNANLKQYAAKGQLTTAEVPVAKPSPAPTGANPAQDETYWRSRGRAIRERWRDAVDEIANEQKEADRLRVAFYAADDPYYRDTRIKPSWDRALDLLAKARKDAESAKGELRAFLEEGQRAGVAPGWLQDGQELEPEDVKESSKKAPAPAPGQPREPEILDEKPPRR